MQSNIQSKGKPMRLIGGLVNLGPGLAMSALSIVGLLPGGWFWLVHALVLAGGVLQIFEARAGWCARPPINKPTPGRAGG